MIKPYRIENIVASITLDQKIDLLSVARAIPTVEYNPEQFPGLIFRLHKPKTSTLIFGSGKMICTGAKAEAHVRKTAKRIVESFKAHGIEVSKPPKIIIRNIVASLNLKVEVNLEKMAYLLENSMYEPEQFPGLIYHLTDPKAAILIFGSGKMICTGAKSEDDVRLAFDKALKRLKELGIIQP